jgi:hypothetical protein
MNIIHGELVLFDQVVKIEAKARRWKLSDPA